MKKLQLLAFTLLIGLFAQAQTAVDFTAMDCNGNSHNLFTELNAGKVVVIVWVMPCATCIAPALSALNEVQNYQTTYPGKVLYYLADDYANTTCTSLQSWASTNGISTTNIFSDAAVDQSAYGSAGMPKIVVLGNASHTVYFTQNNGLNVTNFNAAINAALNPTGLAEATTPASSISIYPNPATNMLWLDYTGKTSGDISIDIVDMLGNKVSSMLQRQPSTGNIKIALPTGKLPEGNYFLRLTQDNLVQTRTFTLSN